MFSNLIRRDGHTARSGNPHILNLNPVLFPQGLDGFCDFGFIFSKKSDGEIIPIRLDRTPNVEQLFAKFLKHRAVGKVKVDGRLTPQRHRCLDL